MKVYDASEYENAREEILESIEGGAVFIYPTDTIYGIGCDATQTGSVMRIRKLKQRPGQPFSVMAPSVEWIMENCEVSGRASEELKRLPGPYTLVLYLKNRDAVSKAVNMGSGTLGVRIPAHWSRNIAKALQRPVVTTSVNRSGEPHMDSADGLDEAFRQGTDFMIDEGMLRNSPSMIIDLTNSQPVGKAGQDGK